MKAEAVSTPHTYHGEGVIWHNDWGNGHAALRYVDMLAGDVLELQDDGDVRRFHVGDVASALRPRLGGGAIVATERGFALTRSADFVDIERIDDLWPADHEPRTRFNDGGCSPDGSFYMGSMAYDQSEGAASMWRLDPNHMPSHVFGDVTISNGLCWSPDGTLAYYNDTPTRTIQVFDWNPEDGLVNPRPFVRLEDGIGYPDGLTVDAEGGVWTALFHGSAVRRYDAAGKLSEIVEVGPSQVTCPAFGGIHLDTLYITTSRENLPDDAEPEAGALFACTPGVIGLPTLPYGG